MILLANLIAAVAVVLRSILGLLLILIFGRVIISWVNADPYNGIVRFIVGSTDPFLRPIRRVMPNIGGGLDFSPIVLVLIVYFLQSFLVATLLDYAVVIKQGG